jgi:hypothetical protein
MITFCSATPSRSYKHETTRFAHQICEIKLWFVQEEDSHHAHIAKNIFAPLTIQNGCCKIDLKDQLERDNR